MKTLIVLILTFSGSSFAKSYDCSEISGVDKNQTVKLSIETKKKYSWGREKVEVVSVVFERTGNTQWQDTTIYTCKEQGYDIPKFVTNLTFKLYSNCELWYNTYADKNSDLVAWSSEENELRFYDSPRRSRISKKEFSKPRSTYKCKPQ